MGVVHIFPSIKTTGLSSEEFCKKLLDVENVACVPGNAFGDAGEGYIRISYAYSLEELEIAFNKIKKFKDIYLWGISESCDEAINFFNKNKIIKLNNVRLITKFANKLSFYTLSLNILVFI